MESGYNESHSARWLMKSVSLFSNSSLPPVSRFILVVTLILAAAFTAGCGASGSGTPPLSGNTSVTLLLSSSANDQLSKFGIDFVTIALTNKAGETVSLPSPQLGPDFIHANGMVEPWLTASVPQGVYTAAVVTIGNSWFNCETVSPSGGLVISFYGYENVPTPVTVNLSAPITITGTAMGLALDLQVSQSATLPSTCYVDGGTFSITPIFNLNPIIVSAQPTNVNNGKEFSLGGQVSSIDTANNSFALVLDDLQTLSVDTSGSTVYQGVNDLSTLAAGMFVDLDAAIQADGSHLATRVAVYDQAALNVMTGPVLFVDEYAPCLINFGQQEQGSYYTPPSFEGGYYAFPSTTVFQISGQFANLGSLPFVPSFAGTNMVPGQRVSTFSMAVAPPGGNPLCGYGWTDATTVTLMTQTINGTVNEISSDGAFTTYGVTLAPYDLFPQLAVQQGQAGLIADPSNVVVYVDGNTQLLNTGPISVNSVLRFNGLIFNDNGTLRMDCGQVNDGVGVQAENRSVATHSSVSSQKRIISTRVLDGHHVSEFRVVAH